MEQMLVCFCHGKSTAQWRHWKCKEKCISSQEHSRLWAQKKHTCIQNVTKSTLLFPLHSRKSTDIVTQPPSLGSNTAFTLDPGCPNASLETYLKFSVLLGRPCRLADSAPGSSWTARRPHTRTRRLWTREQVVRLRGWFSQNTRPSVRVPPTSQLIFLGHSLFFRTTEGETKHCRN